MHIVTNARRNQAKLMPEAPFPSTRADRVETLLDQCPMAAQTPLVDASAMTDGMTLWVKDERPRMGLGSFKALGAAYVIARQAADVTSTPDATTLTGRTFVTASAGNHGLSLAAGARVFGARSVVYIADTVPDSFEHRLQDYGACVVRKGADYAASMEAARAAAEDQGWTLLSDSSWKGYTDLPFVLMEGYLQMAAEAVAQCPAVPSHVFLQAGVGGLAGAVAAYLRQAWGDVPQIIVVEPEAAPALQSSIVAGSCVFAEGPDSVMGRLDCKEPSLIALNGLARDADHFLTLDDKDVTALLPRMTAQGLATTASGGAGLAAALHRDVSDMLGLDGTAQCLCFLSEVAE